MRTTILSGLLVFLFFLSACGHMPEGVELRIDERYLSEISSVSLWVITTKLTTEKEVSCSALLNKKTPFNPKLFNIEKQEKIDFGTSEKQELVFEELATGKRLFVAAAYSKDAKETEPILMGCQEGEVKKGVKLFLAIFLARFEK